MFGIVVTGFGQFGRCGGGKRVGNPHAQRVLNVNSRRYVDRGGPSTRQARNSETPNCSHACVTAAYVAQFPNCNPLLGDMNADGRLNGGDIDPFFACLGGAVCP